MQIKWTHCRTYDEAKDFVGVIYLHEWNGSPFYWGKADGSAFGGNPRNLAGSKRNGRYNPGYKHWIEGCLRHGARLYIGQIDNLAGNSLNNIEGYLIKRFGSEMNRREEVAPDLNISHVGNVPETIRRENPQQVAPRDAPQAALP